jgi:hypothetical protein
LASDRLRDHGLQHILTKAQAAETQKEPAAAHRTYRNPALLRHVVVVAVVVLLVMLVSTSGVYAFSLDAQPGSTLYGTKIFFERARVTLNTSSSGDIRLEMGFSERRMEELQEMIASGRQQGSERWLREYSRNIEGAGMLFDTVSVQEAEELAAQFQETLDHQAYMMQGMRRGLPSSLSEPVEGAYQVCDRERSRMRQRCGQQDTGGPEGEPGGQGQQGEGNCPRTEDSTLREGTSSSTGDESFNDNTASGESGPVSETPTESTTNMPAEAPSQPSKSMDTQGGEGGQETADMGYQQAESPHKGHVP